MRLSVDRNDKGYCSDIELYEVKAYLDGKNMLTCITADEELGYVKYYPVDEKGSIVFADSSYTSIKTEIAYGQVEIRFKHPSDREKIINGRQ